jgi:hypothetical protein
MPENGTKQIWSEFGKPVVGFLVLTLVGVLGYVGARADAAAEAAKLKATQLDERVTALENSFKRYLDEHAEIHREMRADIKELLHRIPKGQ